MKRSDYVTIQGRSFQTVVAPHGDLSEPWPDLACHYCHEVLTRLSRTRDHIVPRGQDGVDRPWNMVWSCQPCNVAKGAKMPTCQCDYCTVAVGRHIEILQTLVAPSLRWGLAKRYEGVFKRYGFMIEPHVMDDLFALSGLPRKPLRLPAQVVGSKGVVGRSPFWDRFVVPEEPSVPKKD